jgi:hypothetical protein
MEIRSSKRNEVMSATAQTMMREYAAVRWPTMNHKGRIARLAGVLGFGHRRTRSLYQNEMGVSLRADELAAIAALRRGDEENRNDFQDLQSRVARLEAALAAVDEDFFDPQMAAYREALHGGRGSNVANTSQSQGETTK